MLVNRELEDYDLLSIVIVSGRPLGRWWVDRRQLLSSTCSRTKYLGIHNTWDYEYNLATYSWFNNHQIWATCINRYRYLWTITTTNYMLVKLVVCDSILMFILLFVIPDSYMYGVDIFRRYAWNPSLFQLWYWPSPWHILVCMFCKPNPSATCVTGYRTWVTVQVRTNSANCLVNIMYFKFKPMFSSKSQICQCTRSDYHAQQEHKSSLTHPQLSVVPVLHTFRKDQSTLFSTILLTYTKTY